ncbi:NUDIX domain-containing protein [Nocardiopsis potens]|uniref:NUDIX domain-containing protein n=1 Tax=Nocardiopsis potens TaxID=1246458 RepID=UPI00035D228C|nr:NUDIX domain-containing protein [Nocardiopsis potens]
MPTIKVCDQRTIGAIITDTEGRLLMITRGTAPAGIAPVAGHWDLAPGTDHDGLTGPEDVVREEVAEEVGLTATAVRPTAVRDVWIPTWCRRRLPDGAAEHGHRWTVYTATVTGILAPDSRETRGAAWYSAAEVEALAERTAAYAAGSIPEEQWQARPGLEPVWVLIYARLGHIALAAGDLEAIASLARTPGQTASALRR